MYLLGTPFKNILLTFILKKGFICFFIVNTSDQDSKMVFEDVNFKKIKVKECDIPMEEEEVLFDKGQKMRVNEVKIGSESEVLNI